MTTLLPSPKYKLTLRKRILKFIFGIIFSHYYIWVGWCIFWSICVIPLLLVEILYDIWSSVKDTVCMQIKYFKLNRKAYEKNKGYNERRFGNYK